MMEIIAFDQHDKWKRFGLYLHLGLDPFLGRLQWLKIWWTNRNPGLVCSYYLEACRKEGGMCPILANIIFVAHREYSGIPLLTQSDPGSENNAIANAHTYARQKLDPSLVGTLQHLWMKDKSSIKPEIMWSVLRRNFTPGFENLLDEGVHAGLYNIDNPSPLQT